MKRQSHLNIALASLSGFVDTAVFVHMGGLFVAHVTGNFVLLGTTMSRLLAQGSFNDLSSRATLQLLSFPIFMVAAGIAAVIAGRCGGGRAGTRGLFMGVTALFALVAGLSLAGPVTDVTGAMLMVVAMATLNAAHRLDPSMGPPFTVMTGNVTGFAIQVVRSWRLAPPEATPAPVAPLAPVMGFLVGCLCGALAQAQLGMGSMIIPTLVMVWVLVAAV